MRVTWLVLGLASCAGHATQPLLVPVADVAMPGGANRFDYQAVDADRNRLVLAHMDSDTVVIVDLAHDSVLAELPGLRRARGVAVAAEARAYLVTVLPDELVRIDRDSLTVRDRIRVGRGPDGVAWDPYDRVVGVSDQADGSISLLAADGTGSQIVRHVGDETGNVVYDAQRHWFWVAVHRATAADRLAAVAPLTGAVQASRDLPGCTGAHGVFLHPDGASAYVACEDDDAVLRVDLASGAVARGTTAHGPDVFAADLAAGRLYLASEHGPVAAYDLRRPGVVSLGTASLGPHAHTVAVDPVSHHLLFPLEQGPAGTPVLRIMAWAGGPAAE